MSAPQAAGALVKRTFETFASFRDSVVSGADPEAVHDMRVAARRLRVALAGFEPYLPKGTNKLRKRVQRAARRLGAVRDLDVASIHAESVALEGEQLETRHELVTQLIEMREARLKRLKRCLERLPWTTMEERVRATADPESNEDTPLIQAVAPKLVRRAYSVAMVSADSATADPSPVRVHTLRKKLKNLRYTLEFVSDLYGSAKAPIKQLEGVQDLLGARQDAISFNAIFGSLGKEKSLSKSARSMARNWAAEERAKVAELTKRLPDAISEIRGPAWVRLWQELDHAESPAAS
jgi:CHAD domain-containing protein